MRRHARVALLAALCSQSAARDTASCSRVAKCNGAVMCDNVCQPGTVQTDAWTDRALALQRRLQRDEPLARATLIGSHNSAITQAYGFGIEQDYLESLLGEPLYTGDDLGEGVCNSHSVLDQLRLGLRHIEIDITAGYFRLEPNTIYVCHTPAPVDKWPLEIQGAAQKAKVSLGNWSAERLSCEGTRVRFTDLLQEIRQWVDVNPSEVVILYLDTKPLTVDDRAQVRALYSDINTVFGELVWTPADGSPLGVQMSEFVRRGKRVIFEDHDNGYTRVDPQLVFTPALWNKQFGSAALASFPNCTINGQQWYTPIGAATPGQLVRGLSFGTANANRSSPGSDTGGLRAQECGVNIVSGNYVQPQDLKTYVWTWAEGEPADPAARCVSLQTATGRWATRPCTLGAADPLACREATDDTAWRIAPSGACAAGYVAAPPTNGYANRHLAVAAAASGASWVRLNITAAGDPAL